MIRNPLPFKRPLLRKNQCVRDMMCGRHDECAIGLTLRLLLHLLLVVAAFETGAVLEPK